MRTATSLGRVLSAYGRSENAILAELIRIYNQYGRDIDELTTTSERILTSSTDWETLHENLALLRLLTTISGQTSLLQQRKTSFVRRSEHWLQGITSYIRARSTSTQSDISLPQNEYIAARALMTIHQDDAENGYSAQLLEMVAQDTDEEV